MLLCLLSWFHFWYCFLCDALVFHLCSILVLLFVQYSCCFRHCLDFGVIPSVLFMKCSCVCGHCFISGIIFSVMMHLFPLCLIGCCCLYNAPIVLVSVLILVSSLVCCSCDALAFVVVVSFLVLFSL